MVWYSLITFQDLYRSGCTTSNPKSFSLPSLGMTVEDNPCVVYGARSAIVAFWITLNSEASKIDTTKLLELLETEDIAPVFEHSFSLKEVSFERNGKQFTKVSGFIHFQAFNRLQVCQTALDILPGLATLIHGCERFEVESVFPSRSGTRDKEPIHTMVRNIPKNDREAMKKLKKSMVKQIFQVVFGPNSNSIGYMLKLASYIATLNNDDVSLMLKLYEKKNTSTRINGSTDESTFTFFLYLFFVTNKHDEF